MADLLSTKPYKGSRDFYPKEMRQRNFMFETLKHTARSFGYEQIDAPLIEPIEIYLAKTSEEIVSQQIYSFEDRGERKVAIRPEMTPTVSRMVAGKIRELARPIRWFSIPNLWRYERPGKGRLREHWQLNCDIFAAPDELSADIEIVSLAIELLLAFGAGPQHFRVYLNHRGVLNAFFAELLKLPTEKHNSIARIMDKKQKVQPEEYRAMLTDNGLDSKQIELIDAYLDQGIAFIEQNKASLKDDAEYLLSILAILNKTGYGDFVEYNPTVVRGFDYYTGLVFEIFDTHPENRRSLFGGGRYNNLVGNFVKTDTNAVGFGMGDVTLGDFLQTHKLIKDFCRETQVYVAAFNSEASKINAFKLAGILRRAGFKTETALGPSKISKQFQEADNKNIPVTVIQGDEEAQRNEVTVKNMNDGTQQTIKIDDLTEVVGQLVS